MIKNFKKLALRIEFLTIIGIFLVLTIGFIFFREEIKNFIEIIFNQFGLTGLFLITFVMDTVIKNNPVNPN